MEYIEKTLGQVIGDLAKNSPDGLAFQFADRDYRRTWKEFDEETTAVAKGFMALGIEKGEKISMWATNTPEWMITLFAAAKIGAVFVIPIVLPVHMNIGWPIHGCEVCIHLLIPAVVYPECVHCAVWLHGFAVGIDSHHGSIPVAVDRP